MSRREIVQRYGLPGEARQPDADTPFHFRLPPARLLTALRASTPAESSDADVFLRALDALQPGLAFFRCDGTLLHTNRAIAGMMEIQPEGAQLQAEVQHFAASLCGLVQLRRYQEETVAEQLAVREVPTEHQRYQLRGSFIGLDLFGTGPTVLIALDRTAADPLSDRSLRERYGLSKKQSAVLRLLIEGKTNQQIAAELGISAHTVRHHAEHIFEKLAVRSRTQVASRTLRS